MWLEGLRGGGSGTPLWRLFLKRQTTATKVIARTPSPTPTPTPMAVVSTFDPEEGFDGNADTSGEEEDVGECGALEPRLPGTVGEFAVRVVAEVVPDEDPGAELVAVTVEVRTLTMVAISIGAPMSVAPVTEIEDVDEPITKTVESQDARYRQLCEV
jgi:hypothetical protein